MSRFRIGLFVVVAITALAAWALPAGAQQSAARVTTITVTAGTPSEFKFKLSKLSAPKGVVIFKVTNLGAIVHDFKITTKKTPNITPMGKGTLRVTFTKAGRYPFMCTVTGHAAAGMKGTFVVK